MEDFVKRLATFVQPDQIDKYMEWLKDNPSIILKSNNDIASDGVVFTCGKCSHSENINNKKMNKPLQVTEWECPICTGDSPKRLGRVHTMMIREN